MCPVVTPLALASHLPVMLKPISVGRTMVMQTRAMGSTHITLQSPDGLWPMAACPGSFPVFQSVTPQGFGMFSLMFSPSLHILGSYIFCRGPSESVAPLLSHSVNSPAESPLHASRCHLWLSWHLHSAVLQSSLVSTVSVVLASHIFSDEHPSPCRPAFPEAVPTPPKSEIVRAAPQKFSLHENSS